VGKEGMESWKWIFPISTMRWPFLPLRHCTPYKVVVVATFSVWLLALYTSLIRRHCHTIDFFLSPVVVRFDTAYHHLRPRVSILDLVFSALRLGYSFLMVSF
jgi:hypothetical protein